jgi:hypothetical protein
MLINFELLQINNNFYENLVKYFFNLSGIQIAQFLSFLSRFKEERKTSVKIPTYSVFFTRLFRIKHPYREIWK